MDQFSLITPVLRCISRALRPCPFSLTQLAVAYCPAFPTLDVFRGRINKSVSHDMKSVGFHNQLSVDIERFSNEQPEGLQASSRWSKRSADHRIAECRNYRHPERVPRYLSEKFWHRFRVRTLHHAVPVVFATLRPPATILQPFGLRSSHRDRTTIEDPHSPAAPLSRTPFSRCFS